MYLNEHLDGLFLRFFGVNCLNLGTNSGTVRILFIFNTERIIRSGNAHGPTRKFILFTFDYGMRCGLLVRTQLSGINERSINGSPPETTPAKSTPLLDECQQFSAH
jgi:hypothetical protein